MHAAYGTEFFGCYVRAARRSDQGIERALWHASTHFWAVAPVIWTRAWVAILGSADLRAVRIDLHLSELPRWVEEWHSVSIKIDNLPRAILPPDLDSSCFIGRGYDWMLRCASLHA